MTNSIQRHTDINDSEAMAKIRPQELRYQVPTEFAKAAANAVWGYLLVHHNMRTNTDLEGFPSDDDQTLVVRLYCSNDAFWRIAKDVGDHFEFSING